VLGNKEFEFVVSDVTDSGNKAFNFWGTWCISTITAVVGRTHFKAKTVSLALLMSSTSWQ
jgi:hypothetical protein